MKTFSLLFVLTIGVHCNSSYAQSALKPCEREFLADYFNGVDKIIDAAVGKPAQLQLTTLPSFQAESGVRLVGTEVYFVQFESSYWREANSFDKKSGQGHMDFAKPRIATKVYHAPLSPKVAHDVAQIYAEAIANAKKSKRMGLDGVFYRFSVPQAGCGEAWSPDPDSPNDRLVSLLELLKLHASLPKPRDVQRNEELIVRLMQTINAH